MSDLSLSTAEAINETPIGPGQEALVEEFVAEREAAQRSEEDQMILGKFKSPEDLARAYKELERKLGQTKPEQQTNPDPSHPAQPYTREQSVNDYGEFLSDRFESAEINPYEMAAKWEAGEDVSSYVDKLVETGIPRQVIDQYLARPAAEAASQSAGLSDADAAELKALVGGEEQFQSISQWAAANLDAAELAEYNSIVDSGNKAAIRWALKALQAKAGVEASVEPELISSGKAPASDVFQSQAEVLEAMNKLDSRGNRLYDVDDAYRAKVMKKLAASDVFG